MRCVPYPWDTPIPLHSISKFPVYHGINMDTDDNFMSLGYILVPVYVMHPISLGHIDIFTFYIKKTVYHGINIGTDDIFVSPGHILVPVHIMCAMSLGHTDALTFCNKIPCRSWCQY